MSGARKRLDRAIRITPPEERIRRVPEWEGDFAVATSLDADSAAEVARGAEAIAWTLRRRQVERVLTGSAGAGSTVGAWLAITVLAVAAFVLGGPVLLLLLLVMATVGLVLLKAGSPSHWSHRLMVASVAIWLPCTGFVWWALGEQFDAADESRDPTGPAQWLGAGLLIGTAAFIGIVLSVIIAVSRGKRRTH
jgi:hypothetical protein